MSGELGPEENREESSQFITQKITGRRDRSARVLQFIGKAFLAGVIFSGAAVCTAALLLPKFGLNPGAMRETTASVRIERDETESIAAEPQSSGDGTAESSGSTETAGSGAGETSAAESGGAVESSPAGQGGGDRTAESSAGRTTETSAGRTAETSAGRTAETSGAEHSAADQNAAASGEGGAAAETLPAEVPDPEAEQRAFLDAMESYPYSMADLLRVTGHLKSVAERADQSVVSVNHLRDSHDWFENDVQTSDSCSGLVVAKTSAELLVLTTRHAVEEADALTVTLPGNEVSDAAIKRLDLLTGLAVLSVPATEQNKDEFEFLEPVPLGNSIKVRRGDFLISSGAPLGLLHSVGYGIVSLVRTGVSDIDRSMTMIYTDAAGNASAGTWILNTDGELVGWVTDGDGEGKTTQTTVIGISEYKGLLERMINGQASPCIGIRGMAVIPSVQEQGVPAGVYVTEVIGESPAFEAGIQPGDIITRVGDAKITTLREYTQKLETLHAQDMVEVTVMRPSREEYEQIDFQLTVDAR